MTNPTIASHSNRVEHVSAVFDKSFDETRKAFEATVPHLNPEIGALLRDGKTDRAMELLEQGPTLAIFQHRDHGNLLQIAGARRKAIQYDVGNPLTASKMTRHQLAAAMYAPFRVVLYENEAGKAVVEYDQPSSLFGQFNDEPVTAIGLELDTAFADVLRRVGV
jgi:hypothetical protein